MINVKARPGEYILTWSEFVFLPNIADWIRLFNALDHLVIVVTNQRCVALDLIGESDLQNIHANMVRELGRLEARIDDVFTCPHEAAACDCRKPEPGLIYQAQRKWGIDLSHSLMIGDSHSDEEVAVRCGMRFLAVSNGRLI